MSGRSVTNYVLKLRRYIVNMTLVENAEYLVLDNSRPPRPALDFIGRLSVIERPLWDPQHPLTCEQRPRSAPAVLRPDHDRVPRLA